MSERILTLFGEEIVPEQQKPAGKSRAKKATEETEDIEENPKDEKNPDPREETKQKAKAKKTKSRTAAEKVPKVTKEKTGETKVKEYKEEEEPALKEGRESINIPEDWDGDKQYYTIGEVAKLFTVKTSHIRFWTNEFKLKVRTTRKGDRLYNPEQIRELRAIHHLVKERGFTLSGAKAKLKSQNKLDVETIDLKQSLLQLRNKLVIIKNQLKPAKKATVTAEEPQIADTITEETIIADTTTEETTEEARTAEETTERKPEADNEL